MMTRLASTAAVGLIAVSMAWAAAGRAEPGDGFTPLFSGKDLTGWRIPDGDNGHWKVVDGVIDYDASSEARGDKALWSEREYGDFVLRLDWRLKEAPFINKNIPYILPDGTHAKDVNGKELKLPLPDADSGIYLRGDGFYQVNIWCWPIGSGEIYSIRTDRKTPPDLRRAVTPIHQADRPVGEWNHFEITVKGKTVKVELNGTVVIPGATIPSMPDRGRIALQHHGSKNTKGEWTGPPSLVQFKNIEIKELESTATEVGKRTAEPGLSHPDHGMVRALLITGGHDHDAAFYGLFDGYKERDRLPVDTAANAFKKDLRDKYDVLIMYDFTRDLDEAGRKNLRDFVEAGKGIVVLHHALLNYQKWTWWSEEVVGGRYRLQREGQAPSSSVKDNQSIFVSPAAPHPVLQGIGPFHITDEAYKNLYMSPKIKPLLTTENPTSDTNLAWIGPCATSRVVAIQLGHGRSAFGHPAYRALVHNAVVWAAGKTQ
jgi:type 1 glutamine amidotransferase